MTLATDLLIGVASGILLEITINIVNGAPLKSLFKADFNIQKSEDGVHHILVCQSLLFSNNLGLKKELAKIPRTEKVQIDLAEAKLVDHSSLVVLADLSLDFKNSGGLLTSSGLERHNQLGHHATSTYKCKGLKA